MRNRSRTAVAGVGTFSLSSGRGWSIRNISRGRSRTESRMLPGSRVGAGAVHNFPGRKHSEPLPETQSRNIFTAAEAGVGAAGTFYSEPELESIFFPGAGAVQRFPSSTSLRSQIMYASHGKSKYPSPSLCDCMFPYPVPVYPSAPI